MCNMTSPAALFAYPIKLNISTWTCKKFYKRSCIVISTDLCNATKERKDGQVWTKIRFIDKTKIRHDLNLNFTSLKCSN